uniref:WD repeat-containing protein 92 n=1 Tax=Chlamydomonas chlamydogama TaxID=225041 RepID=A0A7S2QTR2_9CHLO|mmetsp:Transcript_1915/g.4252  ORF Transcript_1915/g.4252 Transcript_1915/m.4252 type:complete len:362 (+) Transcript_1915:207-1292(+)|eukprot:CAMPEP_0202922894 /NCGR_PEP_ID=MMETSP1392-20130828/78165_1 /ASSEMBLY_ACC=CAM_ASM_000868 /TAXON_ID=225041 /ORGANISM="Chlamydomonas chlamydogama, Strain SAG 11-48b" /LENGTH=361 /DNA_ID=CAMNT_0049616547 /DNA_START=152 /DNA_END=1237 /DNA_ORIENTATION=-
MAGVDAKPRPQILEHLQKSLTVTIYDTKWIPSSARFVALGSYARNTGCLQVYELDGPELKLIKESEKPSSFKCGTFGASSLVERKLATGNFEGKLQIWDLENTAQPVFDVQAHASIVNAMDGCGGPAKGYGAPEIVTCGRDGCVRVWDVRQQDAPVAAFEPADSSNIRDCWCVAFGNSYNNEERCVLAGYDNGDVKMFDLRMNKVRWESNVKNGVCGVQFDRKDIEMNKFVVCCLEAQLHVFDARTHHPKKGFASLTERVSAGSTVWGVHHLPQNREVSMVCSGDGTLHLYRYHYPDQRKVKDHEGHELGVAGSVEMLANRNFSSQPVSAFDWSPDKEGLFVCGAFDQTIRVGVVTKLSKV